MVELGGRGQGFKCFINWENLLDLYMSTGLGWVLYFKQTERCDHSPLSDVFSNQDLVIHLHKVNPRNDGAVRKLMGGVQVRQR